MTRRELRFTEEAQGNVHALETTPALATVWKQVRKTLGLMESNLRHPSLRTHKYDSLAGPNGEDVFEVYAQNKTPCAYRIFFVYGPDRYNRNARIPVLTIVAITPHP